MGWHLRCFGWLALCLVLPLAQANEGLQPKAQDFAPLVLTPPGEAMLLDPEGSATDADADDDSAPDLPAPPSYGLRETERGAASWYGARFHKKRTASGERFDMRGFTAAHRTLPFGTRVCVRSLLNGRAVEVRINDRGPFHAERVIDLSQAAAEKIGGKGLGIKQVSLAPLDAGALCEDGPPPEEDAAKSAGD
ncbi:septal ring lytic transglycosylase RlpA family protein [Acidovorax sp. HDW3]|uniref:septal ring lytic transglycosylase RlpA family protein n=1 Tax=Acidovorax sp. HDW3 TaxID=2714923 RepID=UPI00140E77DA|nr:septal ring lytic transglycosylase RlpA family protein [Acidovorax sp. HDW3]QIL43034.1 septal ring lytic transglycosylase RlpA family protein [Acidovorax sp. HDW3]